MVVHLLSSSALELTLVTFVLHFPSVIRLNVGLQVAFEIRYVAALITAKRFVSCVDEDMPFQIGVGLKLCITLLAVERRVTGVAAQVDNQLA